LEPEKHVHAHRNDALTHKLGPRLPRSSHAAPTGETIGYRSVVRTMPWKPGAAATCCQLTSASAPAELAARVANHHLRVPRTGTQPARASIVDELPSLRAPHWVPRAR
jgi:hypothetical protein